jgi:hypothetical protein
VHGISAGFGYLREHWRGALQVAGFAVCLVSSVGLCIIAGIAGAVADYIGDSRRDRSWTRHLPAFIGNVGITIGFGIAGKMLEGGKAVASWHDLFASPWASFGKHSMEGGWGTFDYTGNAVLAGERLYFGLLGVSGAIPDPRPAGQG